MKNKQDKPSKGGATLSMEARFPRTISIELYDAWQLLRRSGDPGRICDELHLSRPIVDRALNYGHVKNPAVADKISRFFNNRVEKEKSKGGKLLAAAKGE